MNEAEEYLKTPEAARYCKVHVVTLRRAAAAGEVHGIQPGRRGRWRFRRADLDRWLAGGADSDKWLVGGTQ